MSETILPTENTGANVKAYTVQSLTSTIKAPFPVYLVQEDPVSPSYFVFRPVPDDNWVCGTCYTNCFFDCIHCRKVQDEVPALVQKDQLSYSEEAIDTILIYWAELIPIVMGAELTTAAVVRQIKEREGEANVWAEDKDIPINVGMYDEMKSRRGDWEKIECVFSHRASALYTQLSVIKNKTLRKKWVGRLRPHLVAHNVELARVASASLMVSLGEDVEEETLESKMEDMELKEGDNESSDEAESCYSEKVVGFLSEVEADSDSDEDTVDTASESVKDAMESSW